MGIQGTPQPHGTYTEADLERVVSRDFPPASIPSVLALLARYGDEDWQREALRVRMACLKLASGSLQKLEQAVGEACADYRDVLSDAEYPTYGRAHTEEAKERAIARDWEQLQAWLHRK
jgi:hypothetical protein